MILDNNYTLSAEEYCWKLTYKKLGINPKTNKAFKTTRHTYHSTIDQALYYYVSEVVKPEADIEAVLKKLTDIHKTIKSIRL